MKKLDGCSVTPTSTAKFDWSVGIFAKTVTQSELAANAAAKQANCQNLMPPAPWIFFFLQGSTRLASFFVAQRASVNYLSRHVAYLPQFLSAPIGRAAHPVTVWSLPHMLRHSTGYKLANDGHDTRALQHYMGHKNIMRTVRYTEMAPDRFKNFWKD
jgi:hypothetical protein